MKPILFDWAAHRMITEEKKLRLLLQTLPEYLQKENDISKEEGKFWHCDANFLHDRFWCYERTSARKAGEVFRFTILGKLNGKVFFLFVEFRNFYKYVGAATVSEARRFF